MEAIQYKTEVFEGPLDLLLYLISKHKVSINDVVITDLIDQYIEAIRQMQLENMDIASEFLEMAARLVYIKTVSLLPVYEDADKLQDELRGELSEYADCQLMAGKLAKIANGFDLLPTPPEKIEADMTYARVHVPEELLKAYISAIGKGGRKLPPPVEAFTKIVASKIVSVGSRVSAILNFLTVGQKRSFSDFFAESVSRSEMVATFLALLSLVKSKQIYIDGEKDSATVELIAEGEIE
ncbi:MAG: segregation/condensation protein A [Clostridia bacterium]|nr:segregation/condensation protein A [Clostridia bacterium]